MKILFVTNLYPPQELGGYGRSIADFAWGLIEKGHYIEGLTSNAPYLCIDSSCDLAQGPSGEIVHRKLQLKGSYKSGVTLINDPQRCRLIDQNNSSIVLQILNFRWDAVLVGNIDLLGPEILFSLLKLGHKVYHHIGFIDPPYPYDLMPK